MTHEEIVEELKEWACDYIGSQHKEEMTRAMHDLSQILTTYRAQVLEEERQFILNVLDGVDLADKQMGNKGGGTEAIRFALQSRIIDPTN